MNYYIGLIRGINIGGHNPLKMVDLLAMLQGMGLQDSQTLLQSGNFVCRSEMAAVELERLIQEQAAESLGLKAHFYVRSAAQWRLLIENNPFPEQAHTDPSHLVLFIGRSAVVEEDLAPIRQKYEGPERFAISEGHLFAAFREGIGTSQLPKLREWTRLVSNLTGRNWNTVLKLAELTREIDGASAV